MGRHKMEDGDLEAPTEEQLVKSVVVSVKGTIVVQFYDEEKRILKDKLAVICNQLGLEYHEVNAGTDLGEVIRSNKRWTRRKMPLDIALKQIERCTQGVEMIDLTEKLFRWEGEPWNAHDQRNARVKTSVIISKLYHSHKIIKRYTRSGNLIIFVTGNPEAEKYARDSSGLIDQPAA